METAYDLWQQALTAEFFDSIGDGEALTLYVDREIADDMVHEYDLPGSLPDAVAEQFDWQHPDRLLQRVASKCGAWEAGSRVAVPPSLPVLACSVLAATGMASKDGLLRSNYYGRWAQVFHEEPQSTRAKRLETAYRNVTRMWRSLDTWLASTPGHGASTISTDSFYRHIGYPLSQALIRASDREALTKFFAITGLRPGNPAAVPGRELLRRLRLWTSGRDRKLSPRLLEEITLAADLGEDEVPLLAELLSRLAGQWDGTLHEPEREHRRRAARLRLMLSEHGQRLEWTADLVEGLDQTVVGFANGRQFELRADYGSVYAGLETIKPSDVQLRGGVQLAGEDMVLEWPGESVILMRLHKHLNEWVSSEYFEPGEQHLILAAPQASESVREMVNGLRAPRPAREAPAPLSGWRVFKYVRALDGIAFAKTLDRGGDHIHVLEPPVRERITLAGGLRIAKEYRSGAGLAGHFLRRGEPDLLLPTTSSPDGRVEVVLDDRTEKLVADPRVPFPLRVLPLEEGKHSVGTATDAEAFTVSTGLNERLPPKTGALAYLPGSHVSPRAVNFTGQREAIRGAHAPVSTPLPPAVLVSYAATEAYLLGPQGQIYAVALQSPPAWATDRLPEAAASKSFEIPIPDGCIWLAQRTVSGWQVQPLVPHADIPNACPEPHSYHWADTVLRATARTPTPTWHQYTAAARHVLTNGGRA